MALQEVLENGELGVEFSFYNQYSIRFYML